MPSNLLCAVGEQGAHSLAEGPGLVCNLLHYPPPLSTPVPCPELTLPVLLLLCSALWSFKEARKGHLLSLFAQPRHKNMAETGDTQQASEPLLQGEVRGRPAQSWDGGGRTAGLG